MAHIDWEIAGLVTPKGEVHVCGSSVGGDPLFDERLDLVEMIDSLAESHEMTEDHRLSFEGRVQLGALAATLADAQQEVRARLIKDDLLRLETRPPARCKALGGTTVSFLGKIRPKWHETPEG